MTVALWTLPALAGCATGGAEPSMQDLARRVAALEQDIAKLRQDLDGARPAIDRLSQIDGDMRLVVERLSELAALDKPVSVPAPSLALTQTQARPAVAPPAVSTPPATAPAVTVNAAAPAPTVPPAEPIAPPKAAATPAVADDLLGPPRPGIHIGSYRTVESARAGWTTLTGRFDALKGMTPLIYRVNLGSGKGVFQRLIAGPFPDDAEAQQACARVVQGGITCAVTDYVGSPAGEPMIANAPAAGRR